MPDDNQFRRLWDLGYRRLVPIVPPGAPLSERSSLYKRLHAKASDDARGKVPGVKWPDGTWSGFDWVPHEATEADLARWHAMGAGVGIKTGDGLALIDADTWDEGRAKIIRDIIEDELGFLPPVRVGQYPKAGYLLRCVCPYMRTEFGERDDRGRLKERVEILSDGRQFVAVGIHPKTGKPYRWPKGLPKLEDVREVTREQVERILRRCAAALPQASDLIVEGSGSSDVDQATLRGKLETVRDAVAAIANTSEQFPSRESYRDFGYAIKAAVGPEHEAEGLDIFLDWCARWEDGDNDLDVARADWGRMKGPFRRGASWLYELAGFDRGRQVAERFFDPNVFSAADSIFPQEPAAPAPTIRATQFDFPDPSTLPRRQWLYGNHYIRKFLSTTFAPSGVGKSSLTIVEALAMASGKPLLGIEPKGRLRVWLWNGEDPRDELNLRITAAMMHYGLTREDIGDRLFVDTGREQEIVMAAHSRDGTKIAAPVASAVIATLMENRIDCAAIDPFVSSHRVPENDNGAIDLVAKQWAKIADITGAAIELVHHVRKLNGQEITVEDSRGAGALLAAARPKRALAGMTKAEALKLGVEGSHYRFFRVGDERNNLALPGGESSAWFELRSVSVGNGEGSTPVEREMSGDTIGVVTVRDLVPAAARVEDDERETALRLVEKGIWRRDVRAGDAWVGVPIGQALGLDLTEPTDKARVNQIVRDWVQRGTLVEVSRQDASRRMKVYVEVGKRDSEVGKSENVFS